MIAFGSHENLLGYEILLRYRAELSHFVTTRTGGCSQGNYASFNCSPYQGDDEICVRQNTEQLLTSLPQMPTAIVLPCQVHEDRCLQVEESYLRLSAEERTALLQGVDALMTDVPGLCLCVSTADCVPLLLYDPQHRAIAAIHAGWRGTVKHIVTNTVEAMNQAFGTRANDLIAAIGPSISQTAFEVGSEVYQAFQAAGFDTSEIAYLHPQTQKWHIDLWKANRCLLLNAGLQPHNIEVAGLCTYTHHDMFFSARRLGIRSGRMLSGILLHT